VCLPAFARMIQSLGTEVRMIKGVGPQRAELLAQRGIRTLEDLLGYLPFRYEDRIHFSKVKDIQPNGTYTLRVRVMSGQAVRTMRGRDAIYHLLVQDDTGGSLPCKFFHGGYLEGRLKPGQLLILHGKAEVDKLRPARVEMVNPQIEVLSSEEMDSTEVGRIVPIYEAIGTFGSRQIRRAMYAAVQLIDRTMPDVLPEGLRARLSFAQRRADAHAFSRGGRVARRAEHLSFSSAAAAYLRRVFFISAQPRAGQEGDTQGKCHRVSRSRRRGA
jgi:ATP-dependent DNA helicase RecG